jgi:hypothetical protein
MIKAVTDIKSKTKHNELEQSIKRFTENIPYMIEHGRLIAKIRKANYDSLVAEGFTEIQALELCWK